MGFGGGALLVFGGGAFGIWMGVRFWDLDGGALLGFGGGAFGIWMGTVLVARSSLGLYGFASVWASLYSVGERPVARLKAVLK